MDRRDRTDGPKPGTLLCDLDEIPNGSGREFVFGENNPSIEFRMFVVRRGDDAWGYVNACPHVHIPLNYFPDRFVSPDSEFILCANHGAMFNVPDGRCIAGPCAGQSLEAVPIEIIDGAVRVR